MMKHIEDEKKKTAVKQQPFKPMNLITVAIIEKCCEKTK